VRAVLDPNVIISALLSPSGNPARLLRLWQGGEFELIVSASLLEELERALAYPKIRRRLGEKDALAVVQWLDESATVAGDPDAEPPVRSSDPGDDYLIALAAARRAILVSGDRDLLDLGDEIPVVTPAAFLEQLTK
jgi:uncharacterized protein